MYVDNCQSDIKEVEVRDKNKASWGSQAWIAQRVFPLFVLGQGLLLRNTATAVTETTVSGQVQDTDVSIIQFFFSLNRFRRTYRFQFYSNVLISDVFLYVVLKTSLKDPTQLTKVTTLGSQEATDSSQVHCHKLSFIP